MGQENWFKFDSYKIDSDDRTINFYYEIGQNDQAIEFKEKIILPLMIPASIPKDLLDKVLQSLHLILGISYWKMYCPKKMIIPYSLTEKQAEFWNTVYTKGLGEFYFKNNIDFRGGLSRLFSRQCSNQRQAGKILRESRIPKGSTPTKYNKTLVGIGGGKDSIVAVEKLKKENKDITGFIFANKGEDTKIKEDVLKIMGIPYLIVKREIDGKLLNPAGIPAPYNGHVPITAIYSFISLLLSVAGGFSEIIIPNGKSADSGNVEYLGETINHQWSKSQEFERIFQSYMTTLSISDMEFGSNMRQETDLDVFQDFVKYPQYFPYFSSCNKNFSLLHKSQESQGRWCGKCAKCAYTFVMLAAFLPKKEVIGIFGKDLLADKSLTQMYRDLRGQGKMKPFDCVGAAKEVREAFEMIGKL